MPIVDESKQNKGVNNNTRNKQMAIDMEYYNRLNHPRFKSPYLGAKYQQRVTPIRTLNGIRDVFVDNRGTIKQGGHTNSKLYNYSNKNRNHPIKGAYAREVDSWNNNTSPIKALVNSGIGYALAPAAQAVYDYTKAYYKYPQYRKWNKKLQESRTHAWQTDFSTIPQRKVDNIQYQWNKYVTPIGVSTGTIGGFIDIYNNINNREYYPQTSSYHFRQFLQELGH